MNINTRSVLGALAAAAAAVLLAACGDGSGGTTAGASATTSATAVTHNAVDTAFVQGMIPHHTQAVDMADLAVQRAGSDQVRQLATRIQQAQAPEIEQIRGFLAAWGEPETGASMAGMDHGSMGHGSTGGQDGAQGMSSDQQMQQLQQATGTDFDRMFLQMMVQHHDGAVRMAQTELAAGRNPDAEQLARKIVDAQQAEITEMQTLLSSI